VVDNIANRIVNVVLLPKGGAGRFAVSPPFAPVLGAPPSFFSYSLLLSSLD